MRLKTNFDRVEEFHLAFDVPVNNLDYQITDSDVRLRTSLMMEELSEVIGELWQSKLRICTKPEKGFQPDKVRLAKELADLLYVVYGSALTFGIPIDKVFKEVHESNMSKLGEDGKPVLREDGKILKGPNYREADVKRIIDEHRQLDDQKPFPFFV